LTEKETKNIDLPKATVCEILASAVYTFLNPILLS